MNFNFNKLPKYLLYFISSKLTVRNFVAIVCLTTCIFTFIAPVHASTNPRVEKEELLQFTSPDGHVVGFAKRLIYVAAMDHMLKVELIGAQDVAPQSDTSKAQTYVDDSEAVKPLSRVSYHDVWDGVTVVYESKAGSILKSSYYIEENSDRAAVDQIRLRYNRPVRLDNQGNLIIGYKHGEMTEAAPVAWQDINDRRKSVQVAFAILSETDVGFVLGDYDTNYPLVIDPTLIWNTFLGGTGSDAGYGIATDSNGNVYVGGYSDATWGTPLRAFTGSYDAYVAKLTSNGSLAWNTFLGGTFNDFCTSISVDASGNVYAGGISRAAWGTPVRAYTGLNDSFAVKLDTNGNLIWNTFLGGTGNDDSYGIAVDGSGNVYLGGISDISWGVPVRAHTQVNDGYAAKLASDGSLVWNTFLGAASVDWLYGIAVDSSQNVYVAGYSTISWGTPVRAKSSLMDGFAAKLDSNGNLTWNTFLGGSGNDQSYGIALDAIGNVYVSGKSPSSWGVPVQSHSGSDDGFVTKLANDGSLIWNTFVGGSGVDNCIGIAVDGNGLIYVQGNSGASWGTPLLAHSGSQDAFVAQLTIDGILTSNTFLGSAGTDSGQAITVDASRSVYLTGYSDSTWGTPVQAFTSSPWDAFVVRLSSAFTDVTVTSGIGDASGAYGIAWEDYDNDGHLDLWIADYADASSILYNNNGDGTFSASGEATNGLRGGNWIDADNGGYMDLYATRDGSFYDNDGDGTFTQRAAAANLIGNNLGTSAALDYNSDGYIDLYFPNGNSSPGNQIRENNGDGTFTTIDGDSIGLGSGQSNGETCTVADVDNDGDIDIWYNDASTGSLYYNDGDGTFTEDAAGAGVSINMGAEQPYYAPIFGDYNNDGWLDLFLGHPSGLGSRLYINDGDGTFSLVGNANLGHARGAAWGDYDNDGDLDLLLGIDGAANMLFRNDGGGSWLNVAGTLGIQNGTASTKSVSFADYDNDGDLDIYYANNNQPNVLFRNNLNDSSYLKVKVVGLGSGYSPRDGIGTRIELWNSDMSTLLAVREVSGGEGYGNFPFRIQHFGLASGWGGGNGTYVVRAKFTSGIVVTRQAVVPTAESIMVGSTTLNQTIEIVEAATVSLGDHASGQEGNKFSDGCPSALSGAELFSFQLVNNINRTPVVDKITIQLSSVSGIINTDFANLMIHVDDNGDGTIDGSDTTGTVGGAGTVDAGVTMLTFTGNFSIPASTTVNYILKGDVNSLAAGDTITLDLGPSDIIFTSGAVGIGGSAVTSAIHTAGTSAISFSNIATSAGLANTNSSTTGSVAFSDANNDGYVDILFNGPNAGQPQLYLNNGDSTFTASSTFSALNFDRSMVFGDFNNDDQRDVAQTYYTKLHRNDTVPNFTDVTVSSGLQNANPEGAGWLDYDGDGWLDLVHPDGNSGSANLWRNNGNETFTDQTGAAGLPTSGLGNGEWVLVADFDTDSDPDIFYGVGGTSLYLFRNDGDSTFTDISSSSGLGSAVGIDYRAGFCLGDYDNDGDFDLFVSQVGAKNTLYRNNGNYTFSDVTTASGDIDTAVANSYGCTFGDFDHDGDVDIFVINDGAADHYFRNNGDNTFAEIGASVGLANNNSDKEYTGVAVADIDNDGDLDAFVNNTGSSSSVLYRNDLNSTNYLKVKVIGQGSGGSPKDGTGAVVFLFNADGSNLLGIRSVDGGRPMGQDGPIVHFGLPCSQGGSTGTYRVNVLFPGGTYATSGQIVPSNESITIGSTTLSQTIMIDEVLSATSIKLTTFEAAGGGETVKVSWITEHEYNNLGFNLYRSDKPGGPYVKLTKRIIPGLNYAGLGQTYEYIDTNVTRGELFYYRLEDIETSGERAFHGPICVDWDGDGMPDDWEILYGLDPTQDDSMVDYDNDGLANLEEYKNGIDPFNADTDNDGIPDGEDSNEIDPVERNATRSLTRGVEIIADDESGITLELKTTHFDTASVYASGQEFERLNIADYVHGYTGVIGKPEMPVKGVLVDIPDDMAATLKILETETSNHEGYQVYPVPENLSIENGTVSSVGEGFVWDEDAYSRDSFYPDRVAAIGDGYMFRGQLKQQMIFYPLSFNPVTGQITQYSRIRVRIDYVANTLAKADTKQPMPWRPPLKTNTFDSLSPAPVMASIFGAPPAFVNPLLSALSSFKSLVLAAWVPPSVEASGTAYKIQVTAEGIHRIDQTVLTNNSIDPTEFDLSTVRLYHMGEEVAIYVYDDNGNESFDAADYIYFYGTTVPAAYKKYSKYNVYWLSTAGGLGAPKRMDNIDGTVTGGASVASAHNFTIRHELDEGYWPEAPGDDSFERWMFNTKVLGSEIDDPAAGLAVDVDLPIVDVGGDNQGRLKVYLYGAYATDHDVTIAFEGVDVGTFTWSGITGYEAVIDPVNVVDLNDDQKYTVSITCNTGLDKIVMDWFEVTYPRKFKAVNNYLQFTHTTGDQFTIADFTENNLMAFDVTDATDVKRIVDVSVAGSDPYSLSFEPPVESGDRSYLTLSSGALITTGFSMVEDAASDLADSTNEADYIVIAANDIGWDSNGVERSWLTNLLDHRQSQGLRVKAVRVGDIYDEFSYGMQDPQAIKDLLKYAYNSWTGPALQYVLLVGDSTYNPKNKVDPIFGQDTNTDYVQSYLTYTDYQGETVNDEWFGFISGDDLVADLYIGRLPAADDTEAANMIQKILDYETAANTKTWQKDTVLVADNPDEKWEAVFERMNEDAAALLPAGMNPPSKRYLRDGFSTNDLTGDINKGALIVNYSGHGGLQFWTDERIFDVDDAEALTNDQMYPFVVSMSCRVGYFAYPEIGVWAPWVKTLGEALLRTPSKGAAAALMPTGMTTPYGQRVLNTALFEAIFADDTRELGPAIAQAKMTLWANGGYDNEDVSKTFLLFGDPAMALKVPVPRRPNGLSAKQEGLNTVSLSWQAALDANGDPVAGYNVFRKQATDGPYVKINSTVIGYLEMKDINVTLGTRYHYVVRSVDTDGTESVDSLSLSIVPSAPATSLAGSGSGSGGGGCFITTMKE